MRSEPTTADVPGVRIEDYALIGDRQTAALVSRSGSIDWLCLPRFDAGACFAALVGTPAHGRWLLAPAGGVRDIRRRYRDETLVLETISETSEGAVRILDCMPPRDTHPSVVRVVEGIRGRVPMRMELVVRFDYGSIVPWVERVDGRLRAVAGPDAMWLSSTVPTRGRDLTTVAEFVVASGERAAFAMTWRPSHEPPPAAVDAIEAVSRTESWWRRWSTRCSYPGPWRDAVVRSLITLEALRYEPTGGIVAAPTTSLPEQLGGVRNWDYRLSWVRDATFTLYALLLGGYRDEARAWRDWLLRAVAGDPDQLQIMYGPAGERRLTEMELPWLPGYAASRPVRVGNAAVEQFQLDVYGEIMDAMHQCRIHEIPTQARAWDLQRVLMDSLETRWSEPDEGIWEVRSGRRHFVHSKVMAWVAADRAVDAVERFGLSGPADRWRQLRAEIHDDVCRNGYDAKRNAFVQSYGSHELDASLLMMPLVGFLPAGDPRIVGTVDAIRRELSEEGFVRRYRVDAAPQIDGLPGGEGAFLPCSFWLADGLALTGRADEAVQMFERLLDVRNDVGLLSEEIDPGTGRLLGNFPQAFTHVSLVNTALNLSGGRGPAHRRSGTAPDALEGSSS